SSPHYPSKTAFFLGPCFDLSSASTATFSFQYHMLGSAVGSLALQASTDQGANWSTIWSRSADQGSAWNAGSVSLNSYTGSTVRLRFVGTSGSSWQGDLCIDALSLTTSGGGGSCIASFPYSEGFESGFGAWNQDSGDDFDWIRRTGGTPSSNTGPSGAAVGSYYAYVEASSPNYPSRLTSLSSDCFNLTSLNSPELRFQYHMLGNAVGTLVLQARSGSGSWSTIWSESGTQGSSWNAAAVDLSSYSSSNNVQFRFRGTTASSWQGDMCIDALSIGEAIGPSCPTIDFSATSVGAYGAGQDNGSSSVQDAGATLFLQNNAWKSISLNYSVTANTVLEFDFRSTLQGEIHGIGFDNDDNISSNLTFKVHGTQAWGITNYDNYSGSSWTSYTIPVGDFYTGNYNRLFFVADHDASPGNGNAYFRNVKIYEGSCDGNDPDLRSPGSILMGDEGEYTINVYPNPTNGQLNIVVGDSPVRAEIMNMAGQVQARLNLPIGESSLDVSDYPSGVYLMRTTTETGIQQITKFVKQ
ncbi:MAG: T9SS type A sorting domain-containing protein, partial [Bacteroidota bacterium]